jgi:hypothetical protein
VEGAIEQRLQGQGTKRTLQKQLADLNNQIAYEELQQELRRKKARLAYLRNNSPQDFIEQNDRSIPSLPQDSGLAAQQLFYRSSDNHRYIYKSKNRAKLRAFLQKCRQQFEAKPDLYPSDRERINYATSCLRDDLEHDWTNYCTRQEKHGQNALSITWEDFRQFLENTLPEPRLRENKAYELIGSIKQRNDKKIAAFIRRIENAELDLDISQTNKQKMAIL